ncbi:MAG: cupin domain-containing protein [Actinomycetes bacterium]
MPELIPAPIRIPVPGGKSIDEHVGRVVNGEMAVSIAHMVAPGGWSEPAQTPEFDEYTLVLSGTVRVECGGEVIEATAGQTLITRAGERIRYSVPNQDGASYIAVCLPAFSPHSVHRDDETPIG